MFKVARGVAGQDIIHIESTSSGQPSMRACEFGSVGCKTGSTYMCHLQGVHL